MKILHVISSVDPANGGPLAGVTNSGLWMNQHGDHVEVLTLDDPESLHVKNYALPAHALGPVTTTYGYSPFLVSWFKANAKNYDAVIVHGLWQYLGLAVWHVLRSGRVPYFVYSHGMLGPWFKKTYPLKHLKKWIYWPWAEYRVLRDAKAVLFTCEQEKLLARESFWLYKAREVIAGFGTPPPPSNVEYLGDKFLSHYPELSGKQIFLFLGRIHPVKGIDILVQAFANVARNRRDIHLVIAGPDHLSMQPQLQAIASDFGVGNQVTWTGMLSTEMKWGAIYACNAFFLPSHHENFGVVIAESLACGKPVLISNKVNIWREIQQDGAGIVGDDDVQGAEYVLEKYLSLSHTEQQKMSSNAWSCFNRRYTVEAMSKSLISILSK